MLRNLCCFIITIFTSVSYAVEKKTNISDNYVIIDLKSVFNQSYETPFAKLTDSQGFL